MNDEIGDDRNCTPYSLYDAEKKFVLKNQSFPKISYDSKNLII